MKKHPECNSGFGHSFFDLMLGERWCSRCYYWFFPEDGEDDPD